MKETLQKCDLAAFCNTFSAKSDSKVIAGSNLNFILHFFFSNFSAASPVSSIAVCCHLLQFLTSCPNFRSSQIKTLRITRRVFFSSRDHMLAGVLASQMETAMWVAWEKISQFRLQQDLFYICNLTSEAEGRVGSSAIFACGEINPFFLLCLIDSLRLYLSLS